MSGTATSAISSIVTSACTPRDLTARAKSESVGATGSPMKSAALNAPSPSAPSRSARARSNGTSRGRGTSAGSRVSPTTGSGARGSVAEGSPSRAASPATSATSALPRRTLDQYTGASQHRADVAGMGAREVEIAILRDDRTIAAHGDRIGNPDDPQRHDRVECKERPVARTSTRRIGMHPVDPRLRDVDGGNDPVLWRSRRLLDAYELVGSETRGRAHDRVLARAVRGRWTSQVPPRTGSIRARGRCPRCPESSPSRATRDARRCRQGRSTRDARRSSPARSPVKSRAATRTTQQRRPPFSKKARTTYAR